MMTWSRPEVRIVALPGWLVLAACTSPAIANHSWGGYHWARTANPFTLKLGDNLSSGWDSYLVTASVDWSASSVLNTTIAQIESGRPARLAAV